jgi:hypothetical protein
MTASLKSNEVSTSDLEEETEDLAAAFVKTVPAAKAADSAIDEAGDSAMNSAAQMGFLESVMDKASFSAGALSINVGAFTVALRQLHTQIPLIVTALGTLASGLGAVGSAAVGAGGALGGIFAGGFIGLIEQTEEQFANITTTGQATEKVLRAIGQMFRQALEPLVNQENINLFIEGLESVATMANQAAQAVEMVKDDVLQLTSAVTEAGNFDRLLGALQNTLIVTEVGGEFESTGEVLARFLAFVAEKLPTAIDFMNNTLVNLAPSLKQIGQSFLELTIQLVEFAEGAGPAFVDVISLILDSFTELFTAINNLNDSLKGAALEMFLLTAVTLRLASAFDTFMAVGFNFLNLVNKTVLASGGLAGKLAGIIASGQEFLREHAAGVGILMSKIISSIPVLSGFQDKIDNLSTDGDDFIGDRDKRAKKFKNTLDNLIPSINEVKQAMSGGSKMGSIFQQDKDRREAQNIPGINFRDKSGQFVSPDDEVPLQSKTFQKAEGKIKGSIDNVRNSFSSFKSSISSARKTTKKNITGMKAAFDSLKFNTLSVLTNDLSKMNKMNQKATGAALRSQFAFGAADKTLQGMLGSVKQTIGALLQQAATFVKAEISAITYTFSQYGAIAALKQVAVSIYSTITALIAQAASFLASAGAATILNIALAPLTGILLGISIAAALVVGAIGNLDNATKSAKSGFKEFKQFVLALGEALLGYLVPLFNTTMDVLEMILSPIFAIVDGFMLIIDSIMGAVGAGSEGTSMMETLGSVMDVLGSIVAALGPVFDFIGDIIYTSIITPFRIIAAVLGFTVGLFADLVRALINVGKKFKVFETIKSIFTGLKDIVSSVIEFILKQINNLIGALNLIPGIDIGLVGGAAEGGNAGGASGKLGGLKVTETDVKENLESEKEEDSAKSGQAGTSPPNISYEQNVENTANIDAESDEKEQRIKTLVERALKDANTMRRNSAGQGGGT